MTAPASTRLRSRSAVATLALGLQRIADGLPATDQVDPLVEDALRRAVPALAEASREALGEHLRALSDAQLRGLASNVKGVFHELLVAQAENVDGDAMTAALFDALNHPGADLQYVVDGDVVRLEQIKAVASPSDVLEHIARYPDISVAVTDEVAAKLAGTSGVRASGHANADLEAAVTTGFDALRDPARLEDMAEAAPLVAAATAVGAHLSGKRTDPRRLRESLEDAAVGGVAATVFAALLDTIA
ncbi:MAG: hypothetical protein R6V44_13220 [Paracoccaceae bacterium]